MQCIKFWNHSAAWYHYLRTFTVFARGRLVDGKGRLTGSVEGQPCLATLRPLWPSMLSWHWLGSRLTVIVAHQLACCQSLTSCQPAVVPISYQRRGERQNSWCLESQQQPPSPPSLYVTQLLARCQHLVKGRRGNCRQKMRLKTVQQRTKLFKTATTLTGTLSIHRIWKSYFFNSLPALWVQKQRERERGDSCSTGAPLPTTPPPPPSRQPPHSRKNIHRFWYLYIHTSSQGAGMYS